MNPDDERPPPLAESLDWSIRDWIEYHQRELVVRQVNYRGVPCWKNVMDLWVYQEILWDTQVEAVVEIGVMHRGNHALAVRHVATARRGQRKSGEHRLGAA